MLILIALVIATTAGHRVTESLEDVPPDAFKNTTTLYPVSNITRNDSKEKNKINGDATVWKLETAFAESSYEKMTNSSETEMEAVKQEKKMKNMSEEFKPSPHLGTFFEDDSLEIIPTRATIGEFRPLKKPPSGFVSFQKDNFKSILYSPPKDVFRQHEFPYKIEGSVLTRGKNSWRPSEGLDSKPTMEAPMRVPAGGLYKAPVQEAFTERPDDEDFGLNFDDLKDNHNNSVDVKKRVNPWKNLLRLVTAFIPVGLIISALTPNIITVESTGPESQFPHQVFRRSDSSAAELAPISEPCRRRLLCELHSDNNYTASQSQRVRRRHCHRIHCEEPEALARMLTWLLSHRPADNRPHQT
ncbi:uncharacterized protein LOC135078282 [Ostrinia nubilalis]|uniref:uncharacterized protein LOC135078282 n=1 Tax=Ostrinia nubilalis TaxID=29057 RepID=UPI0030825280